VIGFMLGHCGLMITEAPNKKDGRDYLVGGFNPSEKY